MTCQHRRLSIDPRDPTEGFCFDCWNTVHVGPVLDIPTTTMRARPGGYMNTPATRRGFLSSQQPIEKGAHIEE